MKALKIIASAFCAVIMMGMVACHTSNEPTSTHTDASRLVSGEFNGLARNADGDTIATDVQVSITRVEADTIQAVTVHIQSATMNNMDQTGIFNVAKAGENRYLMGSGTSSTATGSSTFLSSLVLDGDHLTMDLTLNSKFTFSTASAAKHYYFSLDRVQ